MIFIPEYVELIETWQTLINNNKIDYNQTRIRKNINFLRYIGFLLGKSELTKIGQSAATFRPSSSEFKQILADNFIKTKDGSLLFNSVIDSKSPSLDFLYATIKQKYSSISKANLQRGLKLLIRCNRVYYNRKASYHAFTNENIKDEIIFRLSLKKELKIQELIQSLLPRYQSRNLLEIELLKLFKIKIIDIKTAMKNESLNLLFDLLKYSTPTIPLSFKIPFKHKTLRRKFPIQKIMQIVENDPQFLLLSSTAFGGKSDSLIFRKVWEDTSKVKLL